MAGKDILIMGLGNEILRDDGIGPRLVKDIFAGIEHHGTSIKTASCGGLEVLEMIKDFKKVIIIDSIRSQSAEPGDVLYFTSSSFRETLHLSNLHDVSFLLALDIARTLEIPVTDDIHIIAVGIEEDHEFGENFSESVEEKYQSIIVRVKNMIDDLLSEAE